MPNSLEEKKELEGIKYLKENNDMNDPKIVLKVYNRIVDGCIFKTEVGISYLRELQSFLLNNNIDRSLIKPIPIVSLEEVDLVPIKEEKKVRFKPITRPEPTFTTTDIKNADTKDLKAEPLVKKVAVKREHYKEKFITSVILNVVLAIIIIIMMVIASSKNNPTILDYEEKIQNKYASWAEELESREYELNQRSLELDK